MAFFHINLIIKDLLACLPSMDTLNDNIFDLLSKINVNTSNCLQSLACLRELLKQNLTFSCFLSSLFTRHLLSVEPHFTEREKL